MKRFLVCAAFAGLISGPTQAQDTFSFDINGRTIRIAVPKHCEDDQCLSISTHPSSHRHADREDGPRLDGSRIGSLLSEFMTKRMKSQDDPTEDAQATTAVPSKNERPASASVTAADGTPTKLAPVAAASAAPAPVTAAPAPLPQQAMVSPTPVAPAPTIPAQTIPAPAAAAVAASDAASPAGVWLTQNKEGKIHIVPCGQNFCGYAVDLRTDRDGVKVLLNMQLVKDRQWSGQVHDPKGGGTYEATMALKSADTLAIRGCAMGGFICRGQTWSRV